MAEVLQRSSAALASAGVDLDEALGLALGANMVIRNPASAGTALKTISQRLQKTKTELENEGEDVSGMVNTISEYRDKLMALTNQRVDILKSDGNGYKSTTEVLREIAGVWDTMQPMAQSATIEILGGVRQANIISSLLGSWDEVERAIEISKNSEGSALRENERVLDSITGKLQQLTGAQQTFATTFFQADAFKAIVDSGTAALGVLTKLTSSVGSLGVAFGAINGVFGLGGKGLIRTNWDTIGEKRFMNYQSTEERIPGKERNAFWRSGIRIGNLPTYEEYKTAKRYSQILREVNAKDSKIQTKGFIIDNKAIDSVEAYNYKVREVNKAVEQYGATSLQAKNAQGELRAELDKLPAEAKAIAQEMSGGSGKPGTYMPIDMKAYENTSTGNTGFKNVVMNNVKSFANGLVNMASGMVIGSILELAVNAIDYAAHWDENQIEEALQVREKFDAVASSVKTNISSLEAIKPDFELLSTGVDSLGNNISLSAEEYARYQEMVSQIVAISPSLIAAYDSEGNALANKNQLIEQAIQLEKERRTIAQQEFRDQGKETLEGAQSEVNQARNKAEATFQSLTSENMDLYDKIKQKLQDKAAKKGLNEETSKFFDPFVDVSWDYEISDFEQFVQEYISAINELEREGSVDPKQISSMRNQINEFVGELNALKAVEKGFKEEGLLYASSLSQYDELSTQGQQALSKILDSYSVSDIWEMGTDNYYSKIESIVDSLANPKATNALERAEQLTTRFASDFSQLQTLDLEPLGVEEYRKEIESICDLLRDMGVENPELIFQDQIDEAQELSQLLSELNYKYQGLNLVARVDTLQGRRQFIQSYNQLERMYGDEPVPKQMMVNLRDTYGSTDFEAIKKLNKELELFSTGEYSTEFIEKYFNAYKELDSVNFDRFIFKNQQVDSGIKALGWTLKENEAEIKKFREGMAYGFDSQLGDLQQKFDLGQIDAAEFDRNMQSIMQAYNRTIGGLDSDQLDKVIQGMIKSLNPATLQNALRSSQTALNNYLGADISQRKYLTEGLQSEIDSLNQQLESAARAHDNTAQMMLSDRIGVLTAAYEHATSPLDRLTEATELYTTAMTEQASTGSISVDTYRKLITMGGEYANTVNVGSEAITVNVGELNKAIDAESKLSKEMALDTRRQAIEEYARLTDQYKQLNTEARLGDQGKNLLAQMEAARGLADGMLAYANACDEAASARARLAALTSDSYKTPYDEGGIWSESIKKAKEYLKEDRGVDAANIISEFLNPDIELNDYKTTKKYADKLAKIVGSSAKETTKGMIQELKKLQKSGGLDDLASFFDLDTGVWQIAPEDLPIISKLSGWSEDFWRLFQDIYASTDYNHSPNLEATDYLDGFERMEQASKKATQAIVRDGDQIKVNVDDLRRLLKGTSYDDENFLTGLLQGLAEADNVTLTNATNEVLTFNKALETMMSYDPADIVNSISGMSERMYQALQPSGGTLGAIDLTEWKAVLDTFGATQAEYDALRQYLADNSIQVIVDGELKGAEDLPEKLSSITTNFDALKNAVSDKVSVDAGIDFDFNMKDAAEFLAASDVTDIALHRLRNLAAKDGHTTIKEVVDVAIEYRAKEENLANLKAAAQKVIETAQAISGEDVGDAGLPGLTGQANAASDAVQKVEIQLQSIDGTTYTASLNVSANTSQLENAISRLKTYLSLVAQAGGVTSGGSSGGSKKGGTYTNADNPLNKISRWATGTSNAKAGLALVNDGAPVNGSSAELIIRNRTNEAYIANGGDMGFTELETGDTVLTAAETQKVLRGKADVRYKRFSKGQVNTSTYTPATGMAGSGSGSNKPTTSSGNSSNSNNSSNKSNNSETKAAKDASDAWDKAYKELQHRRNMDIIDAKQYYAELETLYKQHLKEEGDTLEDYWKAQEEVYKGIREVRDDEYSREFAHLQYLRDMDLISHKAYVKKMGELNEQYYAGATLPDDIKTYESNTANVYKEQKSLHKENYDRDVAALDAQREFGMITELRYYERMSELNEQYWANNIAYADEYRKYSVDTYKKILEAQKNIIDKNIATLDFKLAVHIIDDAEYLEKKRKEIQSKIDVLKKMDLAMTDPGEIEKLLQELYEENQSYIEKSGQKEIDEVNRWYDQSLITAEEAADRLEEINERVYKNQKGLADKYLDNQKEVYELRLQAAKDSYDKETKYLSTLQDMGMFSPIEVLQKEAAAIQKNYLSDPSNVKLYKEGIDLAIENMAAYRNAKIQQAADAKSYFTTRIQHEIDDLEFERDELLEPFEEQQRELQRQQRELQRSRSIIERDRKEIERVEKRLSRDKNRLQRALNRLNHEEDVELRPIQDEQYELQKRERAIQREYSKLLKPYQDAQSAKQREQSKLQHAQELALRPLQHAVNQLSRSQTLINKQYEDRMYPYQQQIKALQKQNELAKEGLDIDRARADLAKAQTEKTFLVYREGLGYVYDTDREAIEEAEKRLSELEIEDQIDKLQKIVEQLEEERDQLLKPITDQSFWLNESIQDIQDYYTAILEPISDAIYDFGEIIQDLQQEQENYLYPIQERLEDISDIISAIQRKYELGRRPLEDQLYLLNQQGDELDEQLDAIDESLDVYDKQLDEIGYKLEDIQYEVDKINDYYDDQIRVLEKHLRYWERIAEEAELLRQREAAIALLGDDVVKWEEEFAKKAWDSNKAWEEIDYNIQNAWGEIQTLVNGSIKGMDDLIDLAAELGFNFEAIGDHMLEFEGLCGHSITSLGQLVELAKELSQTRPEGWLTTVVQSANDFKAHLQETDYGNGQYETISYTNPDTGYQYIYNPNTNEGSTNRVPAQVNTNVSSVVAGAPVIKPNDNTAQNTANRISALREITGKANNYNAEITVALLDLKKGTGSIGKVTALTNEIKPFLKTSKGVVMSDTKTEGALTALVSLTKLAQAMGLNFQELARGRKTGTAAIALTQEQGPEAIASNNKGQFTFLAPGDMVFSHGQTENLWRMSLHPDMNVSRGNIAPPKIENNQTQQNKYTITVGDVIVQSADDPQALSRAIIERLPNQLLQDIRRR